MERSRPVTLSRRNLMALAAAGVAGPLLAAALAPARAAPGPHLHVLKDPGCTCCEDWFAVMEAAGFAVTAAELPNERLIGIKIARGLTPELASCHTAEVEGYVIEGHVPPADIRRLLAERPDAIGLTVPGMPWGSPGMGPETEREAYDVLLIRPDGGTERFAHYPAA